MERHKSPNYGTDRHQAHRDADGSSDSNHLSSQESLIFSIPERTANDSTIMNQNRIRTHHRSKSLKRLKNLDTKTSAESESSFEPNRPDSSSDSNETESNEVKSKSMNQNILLTSSSNALSNNQTKLPINSQNIGPGSSLTLAASDDMTSNALNNPFTSSMLSSAGSTMSNPDSLVPVAFLPMSTLLPCFKRMYDEQQQAMCPQNATGVTMQHMHQSQSSNNFSALNNLRLSNNDFDIYNNNRLSVETNSQQAAACNNYLVNQNCFSSGASYGPHNFLLSQSATMNSLSPRHAFEPPQVTLNQSELDFGCMAEGCCDTKRLYMNFQSRMPTNTDNAFFLVEAEKSSEWSFEEVSQEYKTNLPGPSGGAGSLSGGFKSPNFNDLKAKLGKALSLSLNRNEIEPIQGGNKADARGLKIPIASNFIEFFVHLNLKDVNYFEELLCIQKEQADSVTSVETPFKPVMIKTELLLYYCVINPPSTTANSNVSSASASSLIPLANENSVKRHLMNKIELRFTLGYAYFKTSGSLKEIFLELPDPQAFYPYGDDCKENQNPPKSQFKVNSRLSCRVEDGDKTLTNIGDARRASNSSTKSIYVKKNVVEKLVPLTNLGNIDIDLTCSFSCDLSQEEKDKNISALSVGSYELKLERPLFTIEPNSFRPIRLVAHIKRMNSSLSSLPHQHFSTIDQFQRTRLHLCIETRPNGFTFEIPIKIRILPEASGPKFPKELHMATGQPSMCKSNSSDSRMALVGKSTTKKSQSNVSIKDKSVRLTASRRILFFAKAIRLRLEKRHELNWTNTSSLSSSMLDEEALPMCSFNVQNINQEACQFEMSIVTLLNHGADLSMLREGKRGLGKHSSANFFRFHNSMLSSCTSADDSLTKMTFLLEPNKMFKISLEFLSNLANKNAPSNPICHGLIRISNSEVKKMFDICLIGFCRESALLDIENVSLMDTRQFVNTYLTEDIYDNSLVKHLGSQQATLLTHIAEMNLLNIRQLTDTSSCSHRKLVVVKNKSIHAKCLVYPILFNADLTQPLKSEARVQTKSAVNEKWYVINTGAAKSTLKILYQMNKIKTALSSEGDLVWFELKPEEEHKLNLELISPSAAAFNLVLFSVYYDINAYCSLNGKHLKASHSSTSTFLDRLYERFLDLTCFDPIDTSSLKPARSSSISSLQANSFDTTSNQSMFSNLEMSQLSAHSTSANRDDYIRLIKSSLKCSIIRLSIASEKPSVNDLLTTSHNKTSSRLPDYLFAHNVDQQDESVLDMSARLDRMKRCSSLRSIQMLRESSDTRLDFSMEEIQDKNETVNHQREDNELWALSTNSIAFEKIQPKTQLTSYAQKFNIRNNSKQSLLNFEILCKSVCLGFYPQKGVLKPLERI